MFDEKNRFVIENYQKKPPFSSFLPGIAGPMGVPVWCYYNNRGQAVCSFGTQDKDHSIMEFQSAHVSYRDVSRTGFRTFCKVNGQYRELFTKNCDMHIGMSEVEICCNSGPLTASAVYFGVPSERTAALARVLTVKNTGSEPVELELLDGMSALVPYGLNENFLKTMSNLSKAWMQVEDAELGRAYFRVRASLEDSAKVTEVKAGNFCLAWDEGGDLLLPIVQSSLVFGQDTSMAAAEHFEETPLDALCAARQVTNNLFPCCFLPRRATVQPGGTITVYSIYGQAESKDHVAALAQGIDAERWFAAKRQEAAQLVEDLCAPIACKTADPIFDAYTRQTYLDNLLRGGAPMFFRSGDLVAPFHIYSRKHGDPEREYNYFSVGREYFAQGNGNYRDVNQNRRCDVLFAPEVGAENIHTFFDLIQSDGYNPLVLTPSTYTLNPTEYRRFTTQLPALSPVLSGDFTPGQVAMAAEDAGLSRQEALVFTSAVICHADSEPNADFGEGYWCDHWTYNLDLIESYLAVYPEKKQELLFEDRTYRWYDTRVLVNPRAKRYEMTENGLRQYHALDEEIRKPRRKWMVLQNGKEARSTLIEKLYLLCIIKAATLDASGMGIEMEGGKPGWYDALNGMPGLLGSSMAESCELARLLDFTAAALEEYDKEVEIYDDIGFLSCELQVRWNDPTLDAYARWNKINHIKENYRERTLVGFSGDRWSCPASRLAKELRQLEKIVLEGITKAEEMNGGLIPTYFTYTATQVEETDAGPMPTKLEPTALPLFLEGPVRCMKLPRSQEEKREMARKVRESSLYDRKLRMYKVNTSLQEVSYEAGRAKAFTPGWLENESVWLHMEYKYLLELLKNGLYGEFADSFHDAAVPFLDPERYGRSPLENVSFIASSANPDPDCHGRGFVSRLSGSTAEFLQIWQILFFGDRPFRTENGDLRLAFDPYIPSYLMPADGELTATFLGSIPVVYHAPGLRELIPGKTQVCRWVLTFADGTTKTVDSPVLEQADALAVRRSQVTHIEVTIK